MPGLGASFGRGAATTYQQDLANSDCILFMGSNMAEAHPGRLSLADEGQGRGATLIHVDPRFTRTSALCDVYVGIRAGSDIAFLGGLVNYVLSNERWFKEYVLAYTNASTIIQEGFQDTEDLGGLFSGYDRRNGQSTTPPRGTGVTKARPASTARGRRQGRQQRRSTASTAPAADGRGHHALARPAPT